ncbi:SDR family NAD(P)-dependent oxidoreductase [Methylobacterium platani]|uniref:2-deoxy-D-gluconate 3-dehydrogenase n=2 Tax=Methylobacterium platani TaxID=427683 RepID=A0A179S4W9_9HYPH|nr:SDR family oxidoreductase [Methylobacterium platani]KMO12032.1 2-deoxy-D-gluconate 3-dehydrogenase [Methylobacterium platani JCM 14648]OAS20023.1 2-deoxy-D-gluconate 3-dehydrogenase [Methylobacterium platani]
MDLAAGLKGRHVLVTGASGGLGDHFARLCAGCGAAVTVAARRKEKLDALVRDLTAAGAPEARAVSLDVADPDSIAAAFAGLHALPDVVVNNAGIAEGGAAIDVDLATFDRVIDTNLRGVWAMSTTAARAWREAGRGGVIVNVASILGLRVTGGVGPYTVSKAGVVQMTQALGLEWARYGIRVNALAPGYIGTDINREFFETPPGQAMLKRIPMRRLGRPEDLDGAFLLLAGDASGWMTGATIPVDGGHLVSGL